MSKIDKEYYPEIRKKLEKVGLPEDFIARMIFMDLEYREKEVEEKRIIDQIRLEWLS